MTRSEKDERGALSPKGLRDYLRWCTPDCGSAIRARALLAIHKIITEQKKGLYCGDMVEAYLRIKKILRS